MTRLEERAANTGNCAVAVLGDLDLPDDAFERRWAIWRTRGQAQDEQTWRRMIACSVTAGVGIAALIAWTTMGG